MANAFVRKLRERERDGVDCQTEPMCTFFYLWDISKEFSTVLYSILALKAAVITQNYFLLQRYTDTPRLTQFENSKKLKNCIFKCAEILLVGMKAQWDEGGGRTLLGDNTIGGPAVLRPIMLQRIGVWTSHGLPSYVHIRQLTACIISSDVRKLRLVPHRTEPNYSGNREVSLQILKRHVNFLLKDISSSAHIASHRKLDGMWRENFVAYHEVLFRHFHKPQEDNGN